MKKPTNSRNHDGARDEVAKAERAVALLEERRDAAMIELAVAEAAIPAATTALIDPDDADAEARFAAATALPAIIRARIATFNEQALPAAGEVLEAARRRADQVDRMREYVAADNAREVAEKLLITEYPELGGRFAALLEAVTEAQHRVQQANARLPDGCVPLDDPEAAVRDRRGVGKRKIRENVESLWVWPDSDKPLSEEQARRVRGVGTGARLYPEGSLASPQGLPVLRAPFMRIEYSPEVRPQRGARLAAMQFPALRAGEPDHWPGNDLGGARVTRARLQALRDTPPSAVGTVVEYERLPDGYAVEPDKATKAA